MLTVCPVVPATLGHLPHLTSLDLSHNIIGNGGSAAIAAALSAGACPRLKFLGIASNLLSKTALDELAASMPKGAHLHGRVGGTF
jgi:hypothetical protein